MPSCGHGSQTPRRRPDDKPSEQPQRRPNTRLQRKMLSVVRWLTKPIIQLTYSSSSAIPRFLIAASSIAAGSEHGCEAQKHRDGKCSDQVAREGLQCYRTNPAHRVLISRHWVIIFSDLTAILIPIGHLLHKRGDPTPKSGAFNPRKCCNQP
jgi:hypothetical protein